MTTIHANSPLTEKPTCPLCDAVLLPENPDACPKCDWVRHATTHRGTGRDLTAVCFSVIPGLGHLYKGHRLLGAIIMLGSCFAVFAALLAGFASAGWGLLLLPLYWGAVMLHVYWADDRARHHHTRG
ncbi:MAG: hypothetical protein K8R23_11435 [Chthoniobacter sp.]|nr:hypothetical protein [Chthoniobacter sp.]